MQMDFDVTSISAIVAAAGVLIGVVYYILDMRHQTRVRDTELIMNLYSFFDDRQFQSDVEMVMNCEFKDYDDFVRRYGPLFGRKNRELQAAITTFLNHFDLLGTLLRRKLADTDLLAEMVGGGTFWEKVRPLMEGYRKQINEPTFFADFEYYYNQMKKRRQKKLQQSKA
jgi:hypothetical protein